MRMTSARLRRIIAVAVAAVVAVREGMTGSEGELRTHVKQTLADYKVPRFVHQVDALPRTSTAKIQRSALAGLAQAELARRRAAQPA